MCPKALREMSPLGPEGSEPRDPVEFESRTGPGIGQAASTKYALKDEHGKPIKGANKVHYHRQMLVTFDEVSSLVSGLARADWGLVGVINKIATSARYDYRTGKGEFSWQIKDCSIAIDVSGQPKMFGQLVTDTASGLAQRFLFAPRRRLGSAERSPHAGRARRVALGRRIPRPVPLAAEVPPAPHRDGRRCAPPP